MSENNILPIILATVFKLLSPTGLLILLHSGDGNLEIFNWERPI